MQQITVINTLNVNVPNSDDHVLKKTSQIMDNWKEAEFLIIVWIAFLFFVAFPCIWLIIIILI